MTNNINTSITLYKNEFKAENNYKVTRIGGQRITMQYVLFEDFGAFLFVCMMKIIIMLGLFQLILLLIKLLKF